MLFKSKKNSSEENIDLVPNVKSKKKIVTRALLIVLGVIIGVAGTFLYIQKYGIPFNKVLQNVSKAEEERVLQETINRVSKLIVLPKEETPVIATITDASALMVKEPFYTGSENGDVVLMYQKALKAIIYSPGRNIIVNVGPVYIPPEGQNPDGSLVETKQASSTTIQKKK
jgi:hypothetical protein